MSRKIHAATAPVTAAGARKLARVTVHGGYGIGVDRVCRVIDTISVMTSRRQIDFRQCRAADDFRDAFDVLAGPPGGSLDFDRVRGGGTPGAPPAAAAMLAAERLADAKRILGTLDFGLVEAVAGHGHSIGEAAKRFTEGKERLSTRDEEHVGRRLRDALTSLAHAWHPISSKTHIRGHIEDGAKPVGGQSGIREVETRVAHAGETGVRYSNGTLGTRSEQ